jgi:hypothetical protein
MNIYVTDEEDMKAKLAEAVLLLYRLRKATKTWHRVFGYPAKKEREEWEEKSDEFLNRLMRNAQELDAKEKIKVVEK